MALNYSDVVARQPDLNYVAPQGFFMAVAKLPQVVFNLQSVQIPSLNGTEVVLPNPVNPNSAYIPGDSVDYGQLDLTFIIDKEFRTYRSLIDWVKGINKPEGYPQYDEWIDDMKYNDVDLRPEFAKTMSDITIYATDPGNNPTVQWKFKNAFPISVDGPQFDATSPDVEYLSSSVSFRFMYFEHSTYTDGKHNEDVI